MSIAEKLTTIAENQQKVYNAGYQKGVSETDGYGVGYGDGQANFGIPNEVTGTNIVTCDYVNENQHNVEVKLSSDTVTDFSGVEVVKTRNNMFDISKFVSDDRQAINNGDGTITLLDYVPSVNINKISECCPNITVGQTVYYSNPNGNHMYFGGNVMVKNKSFTVTQEMLDNDSFGFYGISGTTTVDNPLILSDIMINEGTIAKPYDEYFSETYTANADGTVDGVTSISPAMNLICDGVDITAKYYQNPSDFVCEGEIFFTINGTMYKKNHVIPNDHNNGFFSYAYRYADQMETLEVPLLRSEYSSSSSVFQSCTLLKSAYLPRIMQIGATFLGGCNALEEVTLGCDEYPMIAINQTALLNCPVLKTINYIGVINNGLSLQWSPLLTDTSVQNIIDCLADLTDSDTQTLTFHADVEARMTDEQKATITSKNWTLAVA